MFYIKVCRRLDSNHRHLVLEASSQPTVPHHCPTTKNILAPMPFVLSYLREDPASFFIFVLFNQTNLLE